MMKSKELQLVILTHRGSHAKSDAATIRRASVEYGVPYITTLTATKAAVKAIKALVNQKITVKSLNDYFKQ